MPDIELLTEHEVSDYGPVVIASRKLPLWLPRESQVYLSFRGHRYRFSNLYTDFKLSSADSHQRVSLPESKQ